MPRLVLARSASANPMGAQTYDERICGLASAQLPDWEVRQIVARSMRAPLPGNRRLPIGWLTTAGVRSRAAIGHLIYPRNALIHRMDLVLPPGPPGRDVVTFHDVIAWEYADESAPIRAAAEEARRAAAVICVSQYTADRVSQLLGVSNPVVVHNGVDQRFFDAAPLAPARLAELGLTGPFVLHAGGASIRKNLSLLAQAWPIVAAARPGLALALAGPAHPRRTELFGPQPGTVLLGRVDDHIMPGLMASAAAVVIPSTHEGFGLPALEAMAAGAPVVAVNRSALPEVIADAGFLTEPEPQPFAAAVLDAVTGGTELSRLISAARLRAHAFTWEDSAAGHAAVWRRL